MSSSSLIGRRLGKYEITELLGQGGMATVYKGYQPDMDRFVAVKVLPPHPGQSAQFMDRFRLEARTIAQLQHPHILPVHDYGTEGDILFLVMAYVEGGSLKDLIDEGPISAANTEKILRQVASAMDYAHRRGVIHRDIKPDNILLDSEGNAILADFGIVKILEGDGTSGLTATGGVLGTPAYMAPEQSQGTGVTASVDIYALGVIVYEMLSGQQPYQADTPMQVMLKHITEPVPGLPPQPANLPTAIEPVLMRSLAKQPEDRFSTATEFAQNFLRALHYEDTAVNMRSATQRTAPAIAVSEPQITPPPQPSQMLPVPVAPQQVIVSSTDTNPQVMAHPHRGVNPIVLLGGFAIIALLAVLIVLMVVQNSGTPSSTAAINTAVPTTESSTAATDVPATDVPATAAPTAIVAGPVARTFGRLSFNTSRELGDTVDLQANGLRQPGRGNSYAVWLTNTADGSVLPIGNLSVDGMGNSVLRYVDTEGNMLPALYNGVIITEESEVGDEPAGTAIYSGSNPDAVREAMSEIFVASEDGFSGDSLFGGALAEAELSVIHTSYDHGTHDLFGLHNRTEHTINILMGTQIDYDGNDLPENPGFKIGVPSFLDHITERLDFDYTVEGVRSDLRSDVTRVEACINNTEQRLAAFFSMETGWTELPDATESFAQSEIRKSEGMISDLIEGVDRNQNGQVEGFPGECGLRQIPAFGLLIAHMNLVEGEL